MSRRLTPDERIDREMQKLKAMGVTITVNLASGVPGGEERPFGVIADAARRNGIYGDSREGSG